MQQADLYETSTANDVLVTTLLAEEISGAVRWGKTAQIEAVADQFDKAEDSDMASMTAFDADGGVISTYASSRLLAYDLAGILAKAKGALKAGGAYTELTDDHHVVVVPVTTGTEHTLVGTLAIAHKRH